MEIIHGAMIWNQEAETSVLAAILLDNEMMDQCTNLQADDFYNVEYSKVYKTMQMLYESSKPIDLITLKENSDVPINLLFALSDTFSSKATFEHHVKIITNNSTKRSVIKLAKELIGEANDSQKDTDDLIGKAEDSLANIREKRIDTKGYDVIKNTVMQTYNKIDSRMKNPGQLIGVSTGYPEIDNKTGGLEGANLYYIGARPSMGKTALMTQICTNVASKNVPVLVISLEMSSEQLTQRMLAQEGRISLTSIRDGLLDNEELVKLTHASTKLHNLPIAIYDTSGISASQIRPIAKKVKREMGGLGLIAVDYLQYLSGKAENKRIEVENNSKTLKQIAKELDVPVLCLSQLSRGCEARNDKRPILSDLRETGAIEQDADVVAFLYRDEYYNPDTEDANIGEFIIRKNRNGTLGTVKLAWIGQYTAFYSLERHRRQ